MVFAQDSATPGQYIFIQFLGFLEPVQGTQNASQVAGGRKGIRVIIAQDETLPGQIILTELPCSLKHAELIKAESLVAGGRKGVRMIVTEQAFVSS